MKHLAALFTAMIIIGCSSPVAKITITDIELPDAKFKRLNTAITGRIEENLTEYVSLLNDYRTQIDFNCTHPVYTRYFNHREGLISEKETCANKVPFSILSRYDNAPPVWIDPKRVSSIHVLFASKNQSMASRFGHIALRLIVCPEGNTTVSTCDSNLFEHIVLGFQAHIDELSLDTIKALNGDYRAYLFANRFMDVYEEYAIGEFREIYSLPLRLNDQQREQMVRELSDVHWRYTGPYSFFSHNCATMLQATLRVLLPELSSDDSILEDYVRPDKFFEAINNASWVDPSKIESLEVAEREKVTFFQVQSLFIHKLLITLWLR